MRVALAYGEGTISVDVPPDRTVVVSPEYLLPAADDHATVRAALRHPVSGPPLREVVRKGQRVAISVCDGTRPQPRAAVVSALLDELDGRVRLDDLVILVATGTHRKNTDHELRTMFGEEIVRMVRIINHDARDESSLAWLGRLGAGVPVWLNREWVDADVRIATGVVEPHFFAGFSGGPKMIAPGLAGLETVLVLHDARRISHPNARWGITEGNPIHDDIRAIAAATGCDFALDVVITGQQRVIQAFGGSLFPMHCAACDLARRTSMHPVPGLFDVVLTSNAGFPLDQNLYQCVKGMSAASQVVKKNGTIFCAAECRDGFPDHGSYRDELTRSASPRELLAAIVNRSETVPDQWQLQMQAMIQCHARVVMRTSFLSTSELASVHLEQVDDLEAALNDALAGGGEGRRLCVLPYGPLTVPYVSD